ncbi:MAG: MFS transporter, partial [Clostridiaceae bacterium]|nr:MFS transporter [Clostridiaceae bacterium]
MQERVERQSQRWKGIGAAFLSGQAVSVLGSGLVQFAIIWFVTMRANSGTALMIITLTSFIPQLVVAPFAGVWADRYDRRWLIILSDSGIALVTLATAVLFFFGYDHVWLMYIAAAVRSLGGGIQSPAIKAFIPQITPQKELVRINGLFSTIENIVLLLSPVLGGALITLFPVWIVFMVDVVTAAMAVSIMLGLPVPHQQTGQVTRAFGRKPKLKPGMSWGFPSPEELERAAEEEEEPDQGPLPHESVTRQFTRGFAYVRTNLVIRNLMLIYACFMILLSPIATLFPLYIRRHFDAQVWRVSAAQTAVFTGMAVGGLAVSLKGQLKSKLATIRLSGFLVAA